MKQTPGPNSKQALMDEARLVQLARGGDADAFARLYDACFERVYRYIYFRVSDDQTAEDLTSQVFLKAWEHLDRYKPGSSPFLAWLYTIARNQVIDHYRTRKESVSLDDVVSLPANGRAVDEQVEMRFELKSMRDALKYLTEEQQEVLVLRFIADLTTEEIARMMGKQAGAIRALQMRGLHTLSKYLDKEKLA